MRKFKAILSSVLGICFLLVLISGLMMYLNPAGMIMGIPRLYLREIHTWGGIVMGVAVIVHFILNLKIFKGEWRSSAKKK